MDESSTFKPACWQCHNGCVFNAGGLNTVCMNHHPVCAMEVAHLCAMQAQGKST
jgi:hypothetical protein